MGFEVDEAACRGRLQELAFETLATRYGEDARSDFRRCAVLVMFASVLLVAGVVAALALVVVAEEGMQKAMVVTAISVLAGVPVWWQADRNRRSALENRRLQRHSNTIEPYLMGFRAEDRAMMRAALGQRLFTRTGEDDDPLREPVWPSVDLFRAKEVSVEPSTQVSSAGVAR